MVKLYKLLLTIMLLLTLSMDTYAIESSYGGSDFGACASTTSQYDIDNNGYIFGSSNLDFSDGVSTTTSNTGNGRLREEHSLNNAFGGIATYAYLSNSYYWSYDYSMRSAQTSLRASEKVSVIGGKDLFMGGYAYNTDKYAASQLLDESSSTDRTSLTYSNDVRSSINTVQTTQNVINAEDGTLDLISWSCVKNIDFEVKNIEDLFVDSDPVFGPQNDGNYGLFSVSHSELSSQGSLKSYTSKSKASSNEAYSSQSVNGDDPSVFNGGSSTRLYESDSDDDMTTNVKFSMSGGNDLIYSSTASDRKSVQSSTQKIEANDVDSFEKYSNANNPDGYNANTYTSAYSTSSVKASITCKDSVKVRKNYASASDSMVVSGITIFRKFEGTTDDGCKVETDMDLGTWWGSPPTLASILKGDSTITSSSRGAKAIGKWYVESPDGYVANRLYSAENTEGKISVPAEYEGKISYREYQEATSRKLRVY